MNKKLLALLAICTFTVATVNAQYFTLRFAGGYAWPGFIGTEKLVGPKIDSKTAAEDGLITMANVSEKDSTYKQVYGSYGKGMNFTFGFGYMFNPYIGIDLGVSYLKSATISVTQDHQMYLPNETNPADPFTATGAYLNCKINTQAYGLSLMPSIVIQGAKPGWKVYPYARLGLSLPVYGGLKHTVTIDMDSAFAASQGLINYVNQSPYFLGKHTDITLTTEGTISLGVNASIGVMYKPLPYLSVFAEVNGQYLNTRAKSSEITQWDADGVSKLDDRGEYRVKFNYVDELTKDSNNPTYNPNYDKTKPKDDLRPAGPFSNLGINIGITFNLSKSILKDGTTEKAPNKQ